MLVLDLSEVTAFLLLLHEVAINGQLLNYDLERLGSDASGE
jgi:hypothetical protein